jgi:glycosyltransferase involved in cell wall biosynthesis
MSEEKKPSAMYFDCSSTIYTGLNTGIQRVVRNIIKRMDQLSQQTGVPCIPVVVHNQHFCHLHGKGNYSEIVEVSKKGAVEESIRNFYLRSKTSPIFRLVKKSAVLSRILSPFGQLVGPIKRMVQKTLYSKRMQPISHKLQPVAFDKNSMLVLSDAWWVEDVAEVAKKEKQKIEFHITTLFYDLIPVTHSQYMAETNTKAFVNKLKIIKEISDANIGISKFVMDEIIKHVSSTQPADFFYLGSDFSNYSQKNPKNENRIWPTELIESPFYLVVGTLEPRKGHDYILDAFEKMWKRGSTVKLCIVGRIGWEVQDLLYRINYSPFLNKQLFVFNDVGDAELKFLYSKARALIFGSYVEGFGLPLVEAMENGLEIIASDIPVFREICQEYAQYFKHNDVETLTKIIEAPPKKNSIIKHMQPWLNWDKSIEMLGLKLLKLYQSSQGCAHG